MTRIFSITAAVCLAATTQGLYAQGAGRSKTAAKTSSGAAAALAPSDAERSPSGQYSTQDLDAMRAQLLNLADAVRDAAALAPSGAVDLDSLQQAKTQIQQMPYENLNTLRKGLSPSKMKARLEPARQQLRAYADARTQGLVAGTNSTTKLSAKFTDGTTFPSPSGFCSSNSSSVNNSSGNIGASGGSGTPPTVTTGTITNGGDQSFTQDPSHLRIPTSVVLAADAVRFTADAIREFSQDACKEEILGFNASLVCIAVDALWVIADAIDEGIHFCDDDLTGNVIDTTYNGVADIHTDLYSIGTSVDNHISSANTDIDTNITNATTTLNNSITNATTNIDTNITNANKDIDSNITNATTTIDTNIATLSAQMTKLLAALSTQVGSSTNLLSAYLQQIMKLDLTPEGNRVLVPAILTCDGSAANPCPTVLKACQTAGTCAWNNVGPLP